MAQLRAGSKSITGNFRENNEDAIFISPVLRYFIVADGMGGQSAGEKASAIAVEIIPKRLEQSIDFDSEPTEDLIAKIDRAVGDANAEIMALSEIEADFRNMGTTVVFLLHAGSSLFIGGVGDSRAYCWNNGTIEQLTTDHSLTQALLDVGTISPEEAENHKYRNVLYRYLGTKEGGTGTSPRRLSPVAGQRFLLCSDGVTEGLDDSQIADLLGKHEDPQSAADEVVAAAEAGGSRDNISCVVIYVD